MTGMHTPGPWSLLLEEISGEPQSLEGEVIVIDSKGNWVGEAFFDAQSLNPVMNPRANAQVMAAGPELLASLEGLLDAHQCQDSACPFEAAARAAINKAYGTQVLS